MFTLKEIEEIALDAKRRAKWNSGILLLVALIVIGIIDYLVIRTTERGERAIPIILIVICTAILVYFIISLPNRRYRNTKRRLRDANADEVRRKEKHSMH